MTSLCPCLGENSPEALERMKQNKINEDIKRGKVLIQVSLYIDFCYTWIPSLAHVHPKSILLDLAKHCFSIIWRSSKKMNFPKIWRLWLKNCARHAHFNFELLKGVAVSFFELHPPNFGQACIFYWQTNDVFTIKLYLQWYCDRVMLTNFFVQT